MTILAPPPARPKRPRARLMAPLFLYVNGVLRSPLLSLSLYLKTHRTECYRLLQDVRERGAWEAWSRRRRGRTRATPPRRRRGRVFGYRRYLDILGEGTEPLPSTR